MLSFESNRGVRFCDGLSRRDFLRAGAVSAGSVGLSLADLGKLKAAGDSRLQDTNCILLFLVGGPSHIDTFDPKPNAPENVRGPFRTIRTSAPGMSLCEHLPGMAAIADRFALVRSVQHTAAPIHETGHQLMQTGRLFHGDVEQPHYGAVVSARQGARRGMPPFVVLPGPLGNTGVSISHGQGAGYLGADHKPVYCLADVEARSGLDPARLRSRRSLIDAVDDAQRIHDGADHDPAFNLLFARETRRAFDVAAEPDSLRESYGHNTFGQSCLLARRLVEHGVRLVTVNMFDTVFNKITWDCHADAGALPVTLDDYRRTLCPMFDRAYTSLLDDLHQRGMLGHTLVVAMGEFGRTPQLNAQGGRDHWPGVWSILFAGGGVRGGQVVGASDRNGAEPRDRPVTPAEVAATVYHALGIDPATRLPRQTTPLVDARPIGELFS